MILGYIFGNAVAGTQDVSAPAFSAGKQARQRALISSSECRMIKLTSEASPVITKPSFRETVLFS
jgi:hypothetical protein